MAIYVSFFQYNLQNLKEFVMAIVAGLEQDVTLLDLKFSQKWL
jgi:hypothetical protein